MSTTEESTNDDDDKALPLSSYGSTEPSSSSSVNSYPNWRVHGHRRRPNNENDDDDQQKKTTSPFCHSNEDHSAVAPWKSSQFQAALSLYDSFQSCTDTYICDRIQSALECLHDAFRLYGVQSVICSFNGGKDAVVVLHLLRAAHAHFCQFEPGSIPRPRVTYFDHEFEFPEMRNFLHETVQELDLDMIAFEQGTTHQEGLATLVDWNYPPGTPCTTTTNNNMPRPHPMAFVLGTRLCDPHASSQQPFTPSSSNYTSAAFMRVNPILQWSYGEVWRFLRLFRLPYCSLYDVGYTSLGTTQDTKPCPALMKPPNVRGGGEGLGEEHWPAYMLTDYTLERSGRTSPPKKNETMTRETMKPTQVTLNDNDNENEQTTRTFPEDDSQQSGKLYARGNNNSSTTSSSVPVLRIVRGSVGLIVIGDEILKGMTRDVNTQAAAIALRKRQVPLTRVSMVADNVGEIVDEIHRMQCLVDVIVTSGGIGPTHDDVTVRSIATALGCELEVHNGMAQLLRRKMSDLLVNESAPGPSTTESQDATDLFDQDPEAEDATAEAAAAALSSLELTEAQAKMATVPRGSKLLYLNATGDWPVVQCRNVFILPGVPKYFAEKIQGLARHLSKDMPALSSSTSSTAVPLEAFKVVLRVDEPLIVSALNAAVDAHPHVSFGSYPISDHNVIKTIITLEQKKGAGGVVTTTNGTEILTRALQDLIHRLPPKCVLRVENNDNLELYHQETHEDTEEEETRR